MLLVNDFKLLDAGKNTFVAASFINNFSRCTLNRCTLRADTEIAQIYCTGSGIKFNDCLIEGSGIDVRNNNSGNTPVEFRRCIFRNHIAGVAAKYQRYVGEVGVMDDCYFDLIMNSNMSSTAPIFGFTSNDIQVSPPVPSKGWWI